MATIFMKCLASTSATAEQLRQQLDDLHKEADNTRAKEITSLFSSENIINVPRFISKDLEHKLLGEFHSDDRGCNKIFEIHTCAYSYKGGSCFFRGCGLAFTESDKSFVTVLFYDALLRSLDGKQQLVFKPEKKNDARELLFQKKKVMQAMEKLKSRIELFDELAAKLNEAISVKESLLISNMALDLEVSEIKAPTPVRIVSPTEVSQNDTDDSQHLYMNNLEFPEDQELQVASDSEGDIHAENELKCHEESFSKKKSTGADTVQSSREISIRGVYGPPGSTAQQN
ncbi:UNVERIFIED_CONTAM: hypothetical protein Scaly_1208200 [Sesamum calycinum]|uniref:Uncharacterized protein n=1 Tax=Sesamum calycinum TaxID=2727403 RepID=A0AAW2Q4T5_9LAMI